MKFLLLFLLSLNSALAPMQVAEFSFEKEIIKFPKTPEGEVLHFEYTYKNSGTAPLIITEIKVQCNCTKVEFDKTPLAPGATGKIKVSFDTKGKIGYQDRTLEIFANTKKSPTVVRFKVVVDNKHPKQ